MLSDGRKIVDSFLFSEPHELNVLLAKLHAEDACVDEWVAVEGAYTFRGEYKGLALKKIIREDPRFAPFRHKFTVVEQPLNMLEKAPREDHFFEVEFASRELSRDHVLSRYSDGDLVTCSDVDEMLDFSDPDRRARLDAFLTRVAAEGLVAWVSMLKCWYDFDNFSEEQKWFPLAPLSAARGCWRQRQAPGRLVRVLDTGPFHCAFEYSFCFPEKDIFRKLTTFSHDGYTREDVRACLDGNHWVKAAALGQRPGDRPEDYFETRPLTEDNSTRFVRENIEWLRTNNVRGRRST